MAARARELQNAIADYLKLNRWLVWRNGAGGFMKGEHFVVMGTVGLPDLMAFKQGRLLACEVKYGKDRVSEKQQAWLDSLSAHGAIVCVARCLDDVLQALKDGHA